VLVGVLVFDIGDAHRMVYVPMFTFAFDTEVEGRIDAVELGLTRCTTMIKQSMRKRGEHGPTFPK
jgi:hypothetical protein